MREKWGQTWKKKEINKIVNSPSQWRGGFPRHVGVSGLGQEAHAAAGSPAAPVHAGLHVVRSAVLGGQLVGGEGGPDQEASPHQSAGESLPAPR